MDYDKENEMFEKWFSENETRFAHAQMDDKQIAYSAWLASREAVEQPLAPDVATPLAGGVEITAINGRIVGARVIPPRG